MRTTISAVLFVLASITGCAVDGDTAGGKGGAGGKADDGSDQGLHVRAETTVLGPYNEIRWPVVVDDSSEVDDIINAKLGFEDITYENLDEIIRAWAADPDGFHQGVNSTDFEVNANMRNVLSLTLTVETLYAYPDAHNTYLNFNNLTGAPVTITDILSASSLPTIASKLDGELQDRIATLKTELAAEIASGEIPADQWDGLHVTAADLASFSTTPKGITFHYDPGFPHALIALAPDGDFAVSLEDLDAHISADGLWADEY